MSSPNVDDLVNECDCGACADCQGLFARAEIHLRESSGRNPFDGVTKASDRELATVLLSATPQVALTPPEDVARACVLELIRRLEFYQACDLCDAGQPDDDGGDKLHGEECPFHGYDRTKDVEALRAWATTLRVGGDK